MHAGMIDMEVNTTLVQCYPAHEAVPDGESPFPAVVVVHGPFGLDADVKGVANRLARAGFYAMAPDFYASPTSFAGVAPDYMRHPTGGPIDRADKEAAWDRAARLTDEHAGAIFRQALGYLATRARVRSGDVAVVGFSTGGRLAFLMACVHPDEVRACVSFYPPGLAGAAAERRVGDAPLDHAEALRAPVLLFYGALDTRVAAAERDAVGARLDALNKRFELQVFRGAEHDFFCPETDGYDIHASREAWTRMLALFAETFDAGGPRR